VDSSGGDMPALEYSVKFKAEIVSEPAVTEDLKGAAAKKSAPAEAMRKKVEAMVKGDVKALQLLSTEAANRRNAPFLSQPEAVEMMRQAGTEMREALKGIERVVVRGDRATVIFKGRQWMTLVKQDGVWRSDN
jgi:negative regulator of replication initiation